MKKKHYIFGYLFVRFSKLLAVITTCATIGCLIYLWVSYGIKASDLRYSKSNAINLQYGQLEQELEFAKREVSRIGSVGDLPALKFNSNCDNSKEFRQLLSDLSSASERQAVLKERLTDGFASKAELLRSKIRNAIETIEASRAVSSPEQPQNENNSTLTPRVTEAPTKSADKRTVFDSLNSQKVDEMNETIKAVADFLDDLAMRAEKEESKNLIHDARASLNDLSAWLPRKSLEKQEDTALGSNPQPTNLANSTEENGPPPDPLSIAKQNYEMLGKAIGSIQSGIGNGWRIDRLLMETTIMTETELEKCASSESAMKMLRLNQGGLAIACLTAGLVIAFLILVFADFLKSFFDTASSAADILDLLGRNYEQKNL